MSEAKYVVTFERADIVGPGQLNGLRRMSLDEARILLAEVARAGHRFGRVVDAETLEVDLPVVTWKPEPATGPGALDGFVIRCTACGHVAKTSLASAAPGLASGHWGWHAAGGERY